MTQITEHFSMEEFVASDTAKAKGISNTPNADQEKSIRDLCEYILEPLRVMYGKPIKISSGFRNQVLNYAIGGSGTSQHCKGEAADLVVRREDLGTIFGIIIENKLPFDQLIWENTWVHVSFSRRMRGQILWYHPRQGVHASWYEDISKKWRSVVS